MSFSEILLFLVFFIVFYNISDFLKIRWASKKQKNSKVSLFEKIFGSLVLIFSSVTILCLLYYSYIKYEEEYGIVTGLIASLMILTCTFVLVKKVVKTFILLFSIKS